MHGNNTEQMLRDFNQAFAREDVEGILSMVTEDIRFRMASEAGVQGKPAFKKLLQELCGCGGALKLEIFDVLIAGDKAAVNGEMTIRNKDDDSTQICAFCDLYRLREGKIAETTAYIMDKKSQ